MPFQLRRRPRTDPPAGRGLRAGAAQVDLTPELGLGLAGNGPTTNAAQGAYGRLMATLLLLEDDAGTRLLLVTADLFAGSRYLHEALGIALADVGLTTDRILIAASHQHRGPSSILGALSFDRLAGPGWVGEVWDAPFDQRTADGLVQRLERGARAILGPATRTDALVTLRPAELALTAPTLWGWAVNRSGSALDGSFDEVDPDDDLWGDPRPLSPAEKRTLGKRFTGSVPPGWLGGSVPTGTPLFRRGELRPQALRPIHTKTPQGAAPPPGERTIDATLRGLLRKGDLGPALSLLPLRLGPRRPMNPGADDTALVDARLHLLVAREPGGPNIGAFGVFSATPSLLGGQHAIYSPDAFGVAAMVARTRLDTPVPLGIGGGAIGDVNLLPRDLPLDRVRSEGEDLEDAVALIRRVGEAFAAALVDSLEGASLDFVDDVSFDVRYREVSPGGLGLDPCGRQSGSSLRGSELANSPLRAFYAEGMRSRPVDPPDLQSPKPSIHRLERPGDCWPLRALHFERPSGPWWTLLGFPHECSTALAEQLQVVVGQGTHPVTVASPCGEFGGYANTRLGYSAQAYEGSVNLHGRYTGDVLVDVFRAGLPVPTLAERVDFSSTPGEVPLRLGSHRERKRDKPNALAANVRLHAGRFKRLGRVRRPRLEVVVDGPTLTVRAVVEGGRPEGALADGPLVAVGRVDRDRTRVEPFHFGALPADDVHWPFLVWADVREPVTHWRIQVTFPGVPGRIGLVLYGPITGGPVRYLDERGLFG